ncbi:MAG: type II toxin-antitoxin system VapC family toxin [Pacificimonas sp.]
MAFLLDTNSVIDFALGRSIKLMSRLSAQEQGTLFLSSISYAELSVGAADGGKDDFARLEAFTDLVPVLPFDRAAATRYGNIAHQAGFRRHSFDRLIAAHALSLGYAVVTSNLSDFHGIPELDVQNWTV